MSNNGQTSTSARSHDRREGVSAVSRSNTEQPRLSPVDGRDWSYDVGRPADQQILFSD